MTIIVSPRAQSDPRPEELQSLAEAISAAVGEAVEVVPAPVPPPGTAQVTLWEVVNVVLPPASGALISAIVAEFIRWARTRFRERNTRPKMVQILGPNGRTLKEVRLKDALGEPVEGQLSDSSRGSS